MSLLDSIKKFFTHEEPKEEAEGEIKPEMPEQPKQEEVEEPKTEEHEGM